MVQRMKRTAKEVLLIVTRAGTLGYSLPPCGWGAVGWCWSDKPAMQGHRSGTIAARRDPPLLIASPSR